MMQWESYRRSDPLVKFDDVWLRVSEVVLVRPKLVGTENFSYEHTLVTLKSGRVVELEVSVDEFFDLAQKAQNMADSGVT